MLNKKNTKQAEQIAEELKPLFIRAYELGAIYDQTREELQKAGAVVSAYYYTTRCECERAGLDFDKIQAMKHDPARVKEWGALYDEALHQESRAEMAHKVAAINFKNYIDYFAALILDYIRPYWREFIQRAGLSTLAEIINKANQTEKDHSAGAVSVSVYLKDLGGDWARVVVDVLPGWACGVSGHCGKYYQTDPEAVWHCAERPPLVDVEQFNKTQAEIKKLIKKAEAIREECEQVARAAGLLGHIEIISEIKK